MLSYGSTIEEQDIKTLESLGFEVINPSSKEIADGCNKFIELFGRERVMKYFSDIVLGCDVVAFRSLPSGEILSGIAYEIDVARVDGIPIIELPCNLKQRSLDYPTTKQMLIELGHYKTK